MPLARELQFRKFMNEYRTVRRAEGWSGSTREYYRALPRVRKDDPQRKIWRVRERNFRQLLSWIGEPTGLKILDCGAGNGWLSNRLAQRSHKVAAVDLSDDPQDGLGARINYDSTFECFQAEFDRLPFCPAEFDLVVFNAALHYSAGFESTLCEAKRVLRVGGKIVVLDSPLYADEADGAAMIEAREADFGLQFGFKRVVVNTGFLTPERLKRAAADGGLALEIWQTDDGWDKRLRRIWNRRRTGREPARFPLIIFEA